MTLLAPWMLLLLPLVPVTGALALRGGRLQREAAALLRGEGAAQASGYALPLRDRLFLAALVCLVLALARPAWNPHSESVRADDRDLVIALDVSRSMLASDVFPSRLEAARVAVFESLPALRDRRIALITFAGAASVRVPLTLDHEFVRYMLEHVDPMDENVGGTSLQAAIEKATDMVFSDSDRGRRDMIILTDGEDHVSNIEKTAKTLHDCGAHVLIVGLGDPVAGAKVPGDSADRQWMQYKGADVVSRLDEETLKRLAKGSPDVTYFQAGTRPFDLMTLYRHMPVNTSGRQVMEGQETVYTEGTPFLVAVAIVLLFAWRFPSLMKRRPLAFLIAASLAGCGRSSPAGDAEYRSHFQQGKELCQSVVSPQADDPRTNLQILVGAREAFLLAAMFKPGDPGAAREISALTARIHLLDEEIRKRNEEDAKQREALEQALARLKELLVRQNLLAQKARQMFKNRLSILPDQRQAVVSAADGEQTAVKQGTSTVLETVTFYQKTVRNILDRAFGKKDVPPPTEFDEAVSMLTGAIGLQEKALGDLAMVPTPWRQLDTGFHTAAVRMKQALDSLSSQDSRSDEDENGDTEGDREWSESDQTGGRMTNAQGGQFKMSLENRSLPAPNYTAEDILAGEEATQKQRARQKAAHAGANVEKNW